MQFYEFINEVGFAVRPLPLASVFQLFFFMQTHTY